MDIYSISMAWISCKYEYVMMLFVIHFSECAFINVYGFVYEKFPVTFLEVES